MAPLKYVLGLASRLRLRPSYRLLATNQSDPRTFVTVPGQSSPDLSAGLPPLPLIQNQRTVARVFTHRSLYMRSTALFQDPDEDPSPDNERLEFLGDTVLALTTATLLEKLYPRLRVGPTSKMKALIVSNENLSSICRYYELHTRLRCAANQQLTLQTSQLIQANLLESYIGGFYLETSFDEVQQWLLPVLDPYAQEAYEVVKQEHLLGRSPPPLEEGEVIDPNRPKSPPPGSVVDPGTLSFFNQWCSQHGKTVEWKFPREAGGTKATPLWSVVVWIDGQPRAEGTSTGKKGAKMEAAKKAMQLLGIHATTSGT